MEPSWPGFEPSQQDMDQTVLLQDLGLDSALLGIDQVNDQTCYYDEMASAPTPYMAHMDNTADDDPFGEIDTDDLMSPTEVEIGTHSFEITDFTRSSTRPTKRKYEPEPEFEDSDGESVATAYTSKSKSGRKPKGSQKCMSRNAIAARENREKKKAYIDHLEKKAKMSDEDNKRLRGQLNEYEKNYEKVVKENEYLKGILANQSTIGTLIKELTATRKIELIGTSFVDSSKQSAVNTVADSKLRKSHRIASTKGDTSPPISGHTSGICLHIHNKKVSLEMCSKCSQKQNGRKAK